MGNSYRVRIGTREIAAMQPNTILWDQEVRGFVARRQFSDIITFSVVYRTKENVQRGGRSWNASRSSLPT